MVLVCLQKSLITDIAIALTLGFGMLLLMGFIIQSFILDHESKYPPFSTDSLYGEELEDHLDSMKTILNTPLNGATDRCVKSFHMFASLYTEYKGKSHKELLNKLYSPPMPQCIQRSQIVLAILEPLNGLVCDFTATPTLACNKNFECEACTDETTKTDDELKKRCERAERYKKDLELASEKRNGVWWREL
jgi:hypothetical protein